MDKIVLITGGGRGIGAATARACAAAGYDVAVTYRSRTEAAEAVVAECEAAGVRACALAGDVAVEADVVRVFDQATERLGPITGLVNNAGIVARQARVEGCVEIEDLFVRLVRDDPRAARRVGLDAPVEEQRTSA